MSRIFAPHRLLVLDARKRFGVLHRHARVGGLSLNWIRYAYDTRVESEPTRRYYLVILPRAGRLRIGYGGREQEAGRGGCIVVSTGERLRMDWLDGCAALAIKVARRDVERSLNAAGIWPARPPEFAFGAGVPARAPAPLAALAALLATDLDGAQVTAAGDPAASATTELFVRTLLAYCRHDLSARLRGLPTETVPRYVRRVEEYLHLHARERVRVSDIATVAGVSARTLFAAFRRYRGCGPVAFVRALRLDGAHAALAVPGAAPRTVAQVARAWGFANPGRFAAEYRRRHGCAPGATLRQAAAR